MRQAHGNGNTSPGTAHCVFKAMKRKFARASLVAAALAALPCSASAELLNFARDLSAAGWTVVSFLWVRAAAFNATSSTTLEVTADSSAGLLWRPIETKLRRVETAQWRWLARESVPATDLTKKGADDRVLAVYFIFGQEADAALAPMTLLGSPSITALVYVFGGDQPRGSVVASPHMGARGKFIVLRPADAKKGVWFEESVALTNDHMRAFGVPPGLLLAVAISSDSDDTRTRNRAELDSLRVGN